MSRITDFAAPAVVPDLPSALAVLFVDEVRTARRHRPVVDFAAGPRASAHDPAVLRFPGGDQRIR